MSKKSRRRNKKILAALALAGGAAMLGKRGVAQGVSGADKAGFTSDAAYKLPGKATVAADIATDVVGPTGSYLSRMSGAGDRATQLANQAKRAALSKTVRGVVPPSELAPTARPNRFGTLYKGGGIAKRGTGVALKHGGRVKSMGIAKRGGGIAKR